ncbi:MAG: ABC transporter ATP-binding protein [Blastocatellales bacterium]
MRCHLLLREGLKVICKYLIHNTCTRVEKDTSVALVAHLLRVDLATLSRERVGSLHGRIRRSIEGFVKLLRLSFIDFIPAFLTVAFALVVALHRQKTLGLLMAGMVPVALFIVMRQIGSQKGIRLELHRSKDSVDGTVVEQLSGIEYVRAANTHQREVARVEQVTEAVREKELKHHFAMSLYDCGKALNEGLFFILVVSVSIAFAAQGRIPIGDIVTYAMLFGSVLAPLREIHRIIDEAHESALKVSDLMTLMNEPEDESFGAVSNAEPRLPGMVNDAPAISMTDLRMSYRTSDGTSRLALDGVSVAIKHGETIGVAGRSGSGKSSWLRVLLRLAHPSGGRLRIGGVSIESVSREAIGRLIGYVGQTPFLFSGTVEENIAYGCEAASISDIHHAARMANIHEEIMNMPGGYQAWVAERGQNLSGGQRQRLALARVFLKNPPILILDEATSALDNISERQVQEALAKAGTDRTVIIVAHRLSTLRDADRILVFDQGRIVEAGSYDELLSQDRVFAELARTAAEGNRDPREREIAVAQS